MKKTLLSSVLLAALTLAATAQNTPNPLPPISNGAPVIRIVSPPNGAVFVAPATIPIAAWACEYGGSIVAVEFFAGTNSLGVVTSSLPVAANSPLGAAGTTSPAGTPLPFFGLVWSNVAVGQYVLSAVATDNQGITARSEPVFIAVRDTRTNPPPVLTLVDVFATKAYAYEDTNNPSRNGLFTFRRTCGPTNNDLTVNIGIGGTASNGVDYVTISSTVTIPAGQREAVIVVEPIDDNLVESTETVVVTLLPLIQPLASGAIYPPTPPTYLPGAHPRATVYIIDNDHANYPPFVKLVRPWYNQRFPLGATIILDAAAFDRDETIASVEFYDGNTLIGTGTNVPPVVTPGGNTGPVTASGVRATTASEFVFAWTGATSGQHTLKAKATDNQGASSFSNPVIICVGNTLPPVVPPPRTNSILRAVPVL